MNPSACERAGAPHKNNNAAVVQTNLGWIEIFIGQKTYISSFITNKAPLGACADPIYPTKQVMEHSQHPVSKWYRYSSR